MNKMPAFVKRGRVFKIAVEIFVENSIFIGQLFFTYSVVRNKKYLIK